MHTEVCDKVFWVGFVDWSVRDFHGYETDKGSTYNAYLIKGKKNILVDAVKAEYSETLLRNISEKINLDQLDYVICNHAEPDHSGGLRQVMLHAPQATVICNQKCCDVLKNYYGELNWKFQIVQDGESIQLGDYTYTFINTPMAHWPESMATYLQEHKLLFSMDIFGQHFASSARFDDQENLTDIIYEATKYYANIILPLGQSVLKVVEKLSKIDIKIIAPSHGIIWRSSISEIIKLYVKWANHKADKKVVIFYDSMWKSTEKIARAIADGAISVPNIKVKLYDVKFTHITELATQVMECAALAVGTPTLNGCMMPKVAEAMCYLKGLAPRNKLALTFGSYGWSKKGGSHEVQQILESMHNITMLSLEPLQCAYRPTNECLKEAFEKGRQLAQHAENV